MDSFTLLTKDLVFGQKKLSIFNQYGIKAAITDFSILLGGYVSQSYTSEGAINENRSTWWWLQYCFNGYGQINTLNVGSEGELVKNESNEMTKRSGGYRPVIEYSKIREYAKNIRKINSYLEVEYGEYPQMVADKNISEQLECLYTEGKISQSGKSYTTDGTYYQDKDYAFNKRSHIEYIYQSKKYIRFIGDANGAKEILSDGTVVKEGKPYWIKVEPIIWLVEKKEDIAVCKKAIFSGVQYNFNPEFNGDFNDTTIKFFLNDIFSKEIIANVIPYQDLITTNITKYKDPIMNLILKLFDKIKCSNINNTRKRDLMNELSNLLDEYRIDMQVTFKKIDKLTLMNENLIRRKYIEKIADLEIKLFDISLDKDYAFNFEYEDLKRKFIL